MPQQTAEIVGYNFAEGDLFKATLLWEKIVAHLEKSVKCGRHTQALRSYTNCFQGSKAVDCLLVHLNFVLSKTVRRHQVQTLCNKLLLTGVIEDVRDKDKGMFREGRLYRLTKNHFWASPAEMKLPRTRSAEEICTTEKESDVDEKGYASDSTVGGHQSGSKSSSGNGHKKKKSKERDREAHHKPHSRSGSGMLRMKSMGSIFTTPESTPTSALCESQENLVSDVKPRRRHVSTSCRQPSRPDSGHNSATLLGSRRGSVDNGPTRPSKPPAHSRRPSRSGRDETRHSGKEKERSIRTRRLSRSLKEESERTLGQESSGEFLTIKNPNRSQSCSSVGGDYDGGGASPAAVASPSTPDGPLVSVTPASPGVSTSNKWIVYGFV